MTIKKVLTFVECDTQQEPKTKFGGQPDWIDGAQWPISRALKGPMRFIAQIKLSDVFPEVRGKMAYIFMTEDHDEYVDGTWEPDGGENAVIIQPVIECKTLTAVLENGPSRKEFGVKIVEKDLDDDEISECRVGGEPEFMQGEEYPEPKAEWRFLCQLDSCSLPFEINFGVAGIAYVFINKAISEGKFLWQCG